MSHPDVRSEELIGEDWLKAAGFKWHQFERQPSKHWLLWLGDALNDGMTSYEDLGVEVAQGRGGWHGGPPEWFCWLRSDAAGRYHRFIHLRGLITVGELVRLIEGITGRSWDPANNYSGSMRTTEQMASIRREDERVDRRMLAEHPKWAEVEKDDTRGRALPEHMEAHEKGRAT